MGHLDGSVGARHSHVTSEIRRRLMDDLTALWLAALGTRPRLAGGRTRPPSAGLAAVLLAAVQAKIVSQDSPEEIHIRDLGPVPVNRIPALTCVFVCRGGGI
jgi:hypothetical protein